MSHFYNYYIRLVGFELFELQQECLWRAKLELKKKTFFLPKTLKVHYKLCRNLNCKNDLIKHILISFQVFFNYFRGDLSKMITITE